MKATALLLSLLAGLSCFAGTSEIAELNLNKTLDAQIEKCRPVLNLESVVRYAMQTELSFMPDDKVHERLPGNLYGDFEQTLNDVAPYLDQLARTGEVIDLSSRDQTAIQCAAFAKGLILGAQTNVVFGQLLHQEYKP